MRSQSTPPHGRRGLVRVGIIAGLAVVVACVSPALFAAVSAKPQADPQVTGTLVSDSRDARFSEPVDLVIEDAHQLERHTAEYDVHPEWFEGMAIGIAFTADDVLAGGGDAAAKVDEKRAGETTSTQVKCATDLAEPFAGAPGQWYRCGGSGHSGAYFIPRDTTPEADLITQVAADITALSDALDPKLADLGYVTAGSDDVRLNGVVADAGDRRLHLSFGPGITTIISDEGGAIIDYQEQVLRTVSQHLSGWTTVFQIDGDCQRFAAATQQRACSGLGAGDLQPREGYRR